MQNRGCAFREDTVFDIRLRVSWAMPAGFEPAANAIRDSAAETG